MNLSVELYNVFLVKKETIFHPKRFLGGLFDDVYWSDAYYENVYKRELIKEKLNWEEAKEIEKGYTLKSNESISIEKINKN